mmetsp:Transcript_42320/g.101928  ORF Transcript_42320/g.101928 Transcript_42320/m.101928 type:complete len:608 (+) Transcript_42320:182-2005(+)
MTATTTTPTQQHDRQHRLDHGRIIFGPMWYVGVIVIIIISVIALLQEDRALVHLLPYRGNGRNGSSVKSRSRTEDDIDVDILFPLTPSLFFDGSRLEVVDGASKTKKNYSSFLWHTGIGGNIRGSNFTGSNLNLFSRRDNKHPEHDASNSESRNRSSATSSKVATTKIQRIVVLGERHSGTTFVTQYLQDCFGNNGVDDSFEKNQQSTTSTSLKESRIEQIVVSDRLVNTKHWFQPSPEYVVQTVLNDLVRTQHTKHPKDRKKKLSTSSPKNQLQSSFSSSSSELSSYMIGSNDDIDLQWWKEIVFGNNDDNDDVANDYSIPSIEAMMELDENLYNRTTTAIQFNQLLKETRKFFESTFVIVLVRDPYDWMEAVRRKPWHWPNHIDLYERTDTALERANGTSKTQSIQKSLIEYRLLDWEMFVSRQMRLAPELSNSAQTAICQKGLPKGYVSPCHRNKTYVPKSIPAKIPKSFLRNLPFDVNDPVYELNMATDGSQPYQHPLALRTAKLENMLAVPKHWYLAGFNVVPYESLDSGGLDKLTNDILSVYGTQNSNNSFTCPYGPHERSFTRQRSNIPHGFRSWVSENNKWDIENLIGYQSQHRDNHEV